jgi:hypothetical protein
VTPSSMRACAAFYRQFTRGSSQIYNLLSTEGRLRRHTVRAGTAITNNLFVRLLIAQDGTFTTRPRRTARCNSTNALTRTTVNAYVISSSPSASKGGPVAATCNGHSIVMYAFAVVDHVVVVVPDCWRFRSDETFPSCCCNVLALGNNKAPQEKTNGSTTVSKPAGIILTPPKLLQRISGKSVWRRGKKFELNTTGFRDVFVLQLPPFPSQLSSSSTGRITKL